jgi:deazaflavin-dependent oxidoreductase (nitroreductase family)
MRVPLSIIDAGFKALNLVHRSIVHVSGGRIGTSAYGMHVVELHTIGRRSGLSRTTMLTAPVVDGERVVLVASKGGDDRAPDWFTNIVANPLIEITIEGARRPMDARIASTEERSELWPRVVAAYKGYDGYRRRTKREIPLVICEPR